MTPKQARFVEEYLVDLNATEAAIRAGYSRKTAYAQGSRLLRNAEVAPAVKAAQEERAARTRVNADRVVQELARIAFADIREVISWSASGVVTVKPSAEMTPEQAGALAEVQDVATANGRTLRVKMHDKIPALTALARHLGMFKDRMDLKVGAAEAVEPLNFHLVIEAPTREQHEERLRAIAQGSTPKK